MGESESQPDILIDINYMDLGFISSIYRNHKQLCYASNCLSNGFKILHLRLRCNINFMSPCELWKENGTFFVVIEFDTFYEIGIFTPYISNTNSIHDAIYSGLCFTKKLSVAKLIKPIVFKAIHESLHYLITTYITSHGLEIDRDESYYICKLQKEAALKFSLRVPKEVEMRPLRRENWFGIIQSWPYDPKPPSDYIKTMIKVNGGYGIFCIQSGVLLSWGLKTMMGTIEFVYTIPRARRKKYASTIIKMLAVELAKENQHPVATVKTENAEAYSFFEHLGFTNVGVAHDIYLKSKPKNMAILAGSKTLIELVRGKSVFCSPGPSRCYPSSSATKSLPSPFKRSSQRNSIAHIFKMKNFSLNLLADTLEGRSSQSQPPPDQEPLETLRGMATSPSSSSTGTSEDPSTIDSDLEIEDNDEFPSTEKQEENTRKMSVSNSLTSNEYPSVSNVHVAGSNEQQSSTSNECSFICNEHSLDSNAHRSVSENGELISTKEQEQDILNLSVLSPLILDHSPDSNVYNSGSNEQQPSSSNEHSLISTEKEQNIPLSVSSSVLSKQYPSVSNVHIPGSNEQQPSTSNERPLSFNEHPLDSNEHPSVSKNDEFISKRKQEKKLLKLKLTYFALSNEQQPSTSSERSLSFNEHPLDANEHPSLSENNEFISTERRKNITQSPISSLLLKLCEQQPSNSNERSLSSNEHPLYSNEYPSVSENNGFISTERRKNITQSPISSLLSKLCEQKPSNLNNERSLSSNEHPLDLNEHPSLSENNKFISTEGRKNITHSLISSLLSKPYEQQPSTSNERSLSSNEHPLYSNEPPSVSENNGFISTERRKNIAQSMTSLFSKWCEHKPSNSNERSLNSNEHPLYSNEPPSVTSVSENNGFISTERRKNITQSLISSLLSKPYEQQPSTPNERPLSSNEHLLYLNEHPSVSENNELDSTEKHIKNILKLCALSPFIPDQYPSDSNVHIPRSNEQQPSTPNERPLSANEHPLHLNEHPSVSENNELDSTEKPIKNILKLCALSPFIPDQYPSDSNVHIPRSNEQQPSTPNERPLSANEHPLHFNDHPSVSEDNELDSTEKHIKNILKLCALSSFIQDQYPSDSNVHITRSNEQQPSTPNERPSNSNEHPLHLNEHPSISENNELDSTEKHIKNIIKLCALSSFIQDQYPSDSNVYIPRSNEQQPSTPNERPLSSNEHPLHLNEHPSVSENNGLDSTEKYIKNILKLCALRAVTPDQYPSDYNVLIPRSNEQQPSTPNERPLSSNEHPLDSNEHPSVPSEGEQIANDQNTTNSRPITPTSVLESSGTISS